MEQASQSGIILKSKFAGSAARAHPPLKNTGIGEQLPSAGVSEIPRRQTLFFEGDSADAIFEICTGTVELYKTFLSGRRGVLGFFRAGAIVGFAMDADYPYSAEAVTPCQVRRISRASLDRVLGRSPSFAKRLLEATCRELTVTQEKMFILSRKSPAGKVAWFLLQHKRPSASGATHMAVVEMPMSRADIADYLGMAPETLCRTLTKFKRDGLILADTPYRVRLRNIARLGTLAAEACN